MNTTTPVKTPATEAKPARTINAGDLSPIKQAGICSTCVHQGTCLFAKASLQPVWFCDEFTDRNGEDPATHSCPAPVIEPAPVEHYGEAQSTGICVNCESRSECMHRRPGEPVWECEDYH